MLMAVMKIRVMGMPMAQRRVPVWMRVRLGDIAVVFMLMVRIVHMVVVMFQLFVFVFVRMSFGQVQP